jgi:caffeic acid 3-O-methyltransferase
MWELSRESPGYTTAVNDCMVALSSATIDSIVGNYEGFKDVKTLVDVGGGTGRLVREIVKKHPHIHGIVFDLPHVLAEVPRVEGTYLWDIMHHIYPAC